MEEKMEFEPSISNYYKGRIILITGGAGAIGSNLVRALSTLVENGKIIILDNMSSSYRWNIPYLPNVLFVQGDVTDDIDLKRVFNEEPSIVFHLSAFFANQNSIDYPEKDLKTNGFGTLKVLEYSKVIGVKRFVYASSGSIYHSKYPMPLTEESMSMHLSSPYQITKMLGELYTNFYNKHYKLPTIKARIFSSYGPGEVPGQYRNVIPNFIYWAMKGLPLPLTGSKEMIRSFTFVMDLVQGIIRLGYYDCAIGEEFNIAGGDKIKITELAKMINESIGNKAGVEWKKRRKWDTKLRLIASIEKAQKMIDYKPEISFEEGLTKTIKWFKDNWEDIERSADFPPGMSSAVRNE